jgi:putative Mg2+ transporter-C (MgtC) family protein
MFGGTMTVQVTWLDVAIRLGAALACGGLVGLDRGTRGRIAGLRTTILMCLAACGAMIEANLVLSVTGKTGAHFATMDALRFPLGILSGIGFIGAGAIVRRGNLVTGVTTAATLWLITVVGLLLGAGYVLIGIAVTIVAFAVLWGLKGVEPLLRREHRGHLIVMLNGQGPSNEALCAAIREAGYRVTSFAIRHEGLRRVECHLAWYSTSPQDHAPALVEQLAGQAGVESVEWAPVSAGHMFE